MNKRIDMGSTPCHEESRKMSSLHEASPEGSEEPKPNDASIEAQAAVDPAAKPIEIEASDGVESTELESASELEAVGGSESAAEDQIPSREELEEELARVKDQWLRARAELDNARKRKNKELTEVRQKTREDVVREMLPVIDNLERAAESTRSASDIEAVTQGVSMVLRGFEDTADRIGLRRIESVGTRFDPAHHEAWQHTETDEHEVGTVIAEFEPGYLLGTRLLRPAKVAVARPVRVVVEAEPVVEAGAEVPSEPEQEDAGQPDEDVLFIEDDGEAGEDTQEGLSEEGGSEN